MLLFFYDIIPKGDNMKKVILIKYGEMTTKKYNRNQFVKVLLSNIKKKLTDYEYEITYTVDAMIIYSNRLDDIMKVLNDVFGIANMVIAYQLDQDMNNIRNSGVSILSEVEFKTFKVQTKRCDKNLPYTSIEISYDVGGYIYNTIPNIAVDVKNPEVTLNIELKGGFTYLYLEKTKGLGGYPVSVQNKAILMLSGGIDSPVAGYMALKRGIDIECIYFESPPHTSIQALNKVQELTRILSKYKANIKLHIVPFTSIQEAIYRNCERQYIVTILRRMMYRITEQVAKNSGAIAIFNGECIGQVASQTLTSMACINEVTKMPVIRPLACFDKNEVIKIAEQIGTYETSILPYEDCCTIFVAKHPIINPSLEMCIKQENRIDYQSLIEETISKIVTITPDNIKTNKYEGIL